MILPNTSASSRERYLEVGERDLRVVTGVRPPPILSRLSRTFRIVGRNSR